MNEKESLTFVCHCTYQNPKFSNLLALTLIQLQTASTKTNGNHAAILSLPSAAAQKNPIKTCAGRQVRHKSALRANEKSSPR